MSDPFATLDGLLDHLWDRLDGAVRDAEDPMRIVCLATVGRDGPQARMVALRRADRWTGEVEFHSDLRTAKIAALRRDPRASMLAWDPGTRLQIRLSLSTSIRDADVERWAGVPCGARINYGTDPAPGTRIPAPEAVTRTPDIARFTAIVGDVCAIDVVSLGHEPHRRAMFDAQGPRWVAP